MIKIVLLIVIRFIRSLIYLVLFFPTVTPQAVNVQIL